MSRFDKCLTVSTLDILTLSKNRCGSFVILVLWLNVIASGLVVG